MLATLLDLVFGCRHKRLSRPITPVHRPGTPAGRTYVCCLECGKQFHYDTTALQIGPPIESTPAPSFDPFVVAPRLFRNPLSSR